MRTYNVTIRATITKTETVDAANEDEAVEKAHQQFSVLNDGNEYFTQDTIECEDVTEIQGKRA